MANIIKILRKEKRWKQTDLAERLGVTRQTLSIYENSKNIPRSKAHALARIFEVDPSVFFDEMISMPEIRKEWEEQKLQSLSALTQLSIKELLIELIITLRECRLQSK